MVKNQWYVVLLASDVKVGQAVGCTRFGTKLVLWRDHNQQVHCIYDRCIHRGVSLCKGEVKNNHIMCPFHGFEFDGSGRCVLIPANGQVTPVPKGFQTQAYRVVEKYGYLWLYYSDQFPETDEVPFFSDLAAENGAAFATNDFVDLWETHYTRAVENQLDVVHLPFIHRKTIGKGNKTIVNGPYLEVDEEQMIIRTYNEVDHGQKPKSAQEIAEQVLQKEYKLEFRMPALWQNHVFDKLRITIAFSPIDEEHTMIYMRTWQKIMTVPGLKQVLNWQSMRQAIQVLYEDKYVVESQEPKATSLRMGEKLIKGDQPIIVFRQMRERLLQEMD
ncbi:MAG: Rieske 2Fe-2S domain-containing protein [Culicoidibacterales bacterium]